MNILITGCNGQLGNELQLQQAACSEHRFFNTDVQDLDITDAEAIQAYVDGHEIDGIVNCAAYTAVDKAESAPLLCHRLNAVAPAYLAEAIERRGGFLIQVSTDYVFDGTHHTPYVETDDPCPNSMYGRTKLEGETAAQDHCQRTMIIRTAWLYSTFGNNFVKTMLRLGRERQELGVVFDQIGTPTCAADLAGAIAAIISQGLQPGIYHYSNEGVTSWYDFTRMILRISNAIRAERGESPAVCDIRPCHSSEFPSPVVRPAYSVLDKTRIKDTFGITVPYWVDSLEACIRNMADRQSPGNN